MDVWTINMSGSSDSVMQHSGKTVEVAKRSLGHFALGRIFSALVGVGFLLLLVRVLDRESYGIYIALFAAFEIVQLAASPGAYALVFRYLPELRAAHAGHELSKVAFWLLAYRVSTLTTAALLLWHFKEHFSSIAGFPAAASVVAIYGFILVFEGIARFVDMTFESLLNQGHAQASVLFRNGLKLGCLVFASGWGVHEIALADWLRIEAATSAAGALLSCVLLAVRIFPGRNEGRDKEAALTLDRILRFCAPTYLSQVLYISSGTEMVKLIVSKLLGASTTAAFGFAALLTGTIQKYLPSFLLIGWVRPLFITARTQGHGHSALVELSGTIIKLNLLVLSPIAVALFVGGQVIIDLITGGKLPDSLPYVNFFLLLLVAQTVRAVVSLLGITLEIGAGSLRATFVSLIGLTAGIALYPVLGAWALCAGLLATEVLWTLVMVRHLRRSGMHYGIPLFPIFKFGMTVLACGAGGILMLRTLRLDAGTVIPVLVVASLAAASCLLVLAVFRPFNDRERELINRMLPLKLFVW